MADLVGREVLDGPPLPDPSSNVRRRDVEEGDLAEVDAVSRGAPETVFPGLEDELGGHVRGEVPREPAGLVARAGHDDEVAQVEEVLPVFPRLDLVERVETEDEVELDVFQVLVEKVLDRLDGVGLAGTPAFHVGNGEGGVRLDGLADHLEAVAEGGDVLARLVGRLRGRDEDDPVQVEKFHDFLGAPEVGQVYRVKGAAEQTPFHVLTCPFP